jgi:regulator of sigma E protease
MIFPHLFPLADIWQLFPNIWRYILLAAGLGFVVFFHELGHFLAAKWCGVRVDQFAVGFGSAVVAYRTGIGFRRGTTTPEMETRIEEHLEAQQLGQTETEEKSPFTPEQIDRAAAELGFGETEYRLNWIPLGGYVKMLGQDDLSPEMASNDPRSYLNKPIRSRMLIVSAGVLMNVLLAAIGFMIVFLMGYESPPAEVGGVLAGSPATFAMTEDGVRAPLQVGDHILKLDGATQQDFGKLALTVALTHEGETIPMEVLRRDGTKENLRLTPTRAAGDSQGLLSLGIIPPATLSGPEVSDQPDAELENPDLYPPEIQEMQPGDVVTAINGQPVPESLKGDNFWLLDSAVAQSDGHNLDLTVRGAKGDTRTIVVRPHFQSSFSAESDLSLAGMAPRVRVDSLMSDSPAVGVLKPGDVVESIQTDGGKTIENPSSTTLRDAINAAGQQDKEIVLKVRAAGGESRTIKPIVPNVRLGNDRRGLAVGLGCDEQNTVVALVEPDSAAAKAGIMPGWRISSVGVEAVSNWFQVRRILSAAGAGQAVSVTAQTPDGEKTVNLTLSQDEIDAMKFMTFATDLPLRGRVEMRKTHNPITAAQWGVVETRDFILQFYVTIRRMVSGSVSYKTAMGPVGIVRFGAATAARGVNVLVWFLAMISANLAVANFLPIPVMDGGLFVLLIVEGLRGKPLPVRTQLIIQNVGLAIILSIFLLVTYQDITRSFGHG